jgi:hypothetical protein
MLPTPESYQRSSEHLLGKGNAPGKAARAVVMAAARAAIKPGAHKGQRAALSNGKILLPGVSGNSLWARRMRDLMEDHIADLGGRENTSSSERNLVRRAAALTIQAELLEQQFALESTVDPDTVDTYGRICGHLRRLLEAVGLQRRPRTVGTSLGDLMVADLKAQREREAQQPVEIEATASEDAP